MENIIITKWIKTSSQQKILKVDREKKTYLIEGTEIRMRDFILEKHIIRG